ncbi:MAG: CIA30 family protein [Halothiobacillaceae bacterium]|nr:CIA30 family protein [Halothiobacillaceae bacterium]HUM98926.1 CIA30 family protein [Halothiobacillus sp.]
MTRQHHPLHHDPTEANAHWRSADDRVMGGVSVGEIKPQIIENTACTCLSGRVSLDNRGGFIQMKWPFESPFDASAYTGVFLDAWGNEETYNVHLRTHQLWLPWQSFRHSFNTNPAWQRFYLPFDEFTPHKTQAKLNLSRLKTLAIVAIGRAFTAEVCIKQLGFYTD